jgi:methionyl-tRNA synthetase
VVDPIELADAFGVDALRYFLLREVSFGSDGSYSEEAIVTRVNADLANNFGNLGQRCLSIIAKACEGVVPDHAASTEQDQALLDKLDVLAATADTMIEHHLDISGALQTIWEGMTATNQYFAEQAPWSVRKTDPARGDAVLYFTAEALRRLAIMAYWAIPEGCAKMLGLLGRTAPANRNERYDALVSGATLPSPTGVFPRLELPA